MIRLTMRFIVAIFTALVFAGCGHSTSALSKAAVRNDVVKLGRLLDKGADQRSKDDALLDAAMAGSVEAVSLLIDRGANVNARYQNGNDTPLHFASRHDDRAHFEIVKTLLDRGATVDARDREGNTALMQADAPMVELLLARGANPSVINVRGESPFSRFVGRPDVLRALCSHASSIPAVRPGNPPLFVQAGPGDAVVLQTGTTGIPAKLISAAATDPAGHAALREALGLRPNDQLPPHDWIPPPRIFALSPGSHRVTLNPVVQESGGDSVEESHPTLELAAQAGMLYVVLPGFSRSAGRFEFQVVPVEGCKALRGHTGAPAPTADDTR